MNTLVCFAVRVEARYFRPPAGCRVIVTGMGGRAAGAALADALRSATPSLVVTCGFAGGLHPELPSGTLLFETSHAPSALALRTLGVRPASFFCAPRVAVTRTEKQALRESTGADAVEMESGVIREACRERAIASVTLRVISDTAGEDLPLDFNELITPEGALRLAGLVAGMVRKPGCLPGLIRLQRLTNRAARVLGRCLEDWLRER